MSTIEPEGTPGRKGRPGKLPEPTPFPQGVSAKAAERLGIAVGGPGVAQTIRRPPTTLFESPEGSEEEDEAEEETDQLSDQDEVGSPTSPAGGSANGSTNNLLLGRGASTWVAPDEWAAPPPPSILSRENSRSGTLSHAVSSRTITASSSSRTITAASSSKTVKQLGLDTLFPPPPSKSNPPTPTHLTHSRGGSTVSNPPTPTLLTHTRGGSNVSATSIVSSASSGAYSDSDPGPLRFSSGRAQHPGLLLWPSTFIPLSPQELEMHATKHVQTLLGCKPALAEYVASFVDPETGARVVSDEEFADAVWEYECFRRPRFNWPELPENRLEAEEVALDVPTPASAKSMQNVGLPPRTPTTPTPIALETAPKSAREPRPFLPHELTHVRTFRIFSAVKGGLVSAPPLAALPPLGEVAYLVLITIRPLPLSQLASLCICFIRPALTRRRSLRPAPTHFPTLSSPHLHVSAHAPLALSFYLVPVF
ncbi:Methyltransf-25 domain-containing protein [Mycena sanguinolenta]|uniref:Methyltransf-25 domain-containing protein n=1 Tax=Mycena sanguinolenta TaxID=230812 RepID=A0A8H7D0E4_9AGAR|nr:Methyltransf-25 domain-containing protein [Mycena sanguinolenta]